MRLVVYVLFLLGMLLSGAEEPEVWGMVQHEDVQMIITVKEGDTLTVFLDNPADTIDEIYLSRDENCARVTVVLEEFTILDHGYSARVPKDGHIRQLKQNTHLHICTNPQIYFAFERSLFFDATREEEEGQKFIILYVICVCLSCLFSGLNLALLSLDVETLGMIQRYDKNPKMRRYAEDIIPIRRNPNLMICTIILGNTLVNVMSITIFGMMTEDYEMIPWVRVLVMIIFPTIVLLVFGEILPQIVCTKYALAIGAHLKMVMQFFTFITYPLSKPLSWILDFFIGKEKEKSSALREIVRYAGRKDNMAMIANNTLELRRKLARDVMTPLSRVKMLSDEDKINAKLRQSIRMGHTRMPVCKGGDPNNMIGVLNVKDLLLLDESDHITVGTVLQLWPRESTCSFASGDTPVAQLMQMLRNNATMVIVTEYQQNELKNVPTGIVTLEDLLEEVVGEIYDEKDRVKMTGDEKEPSKEEKSGNNTKKRQEERPKKKQNHYT